MSLGIQIMHMMFEEDVAMYAGPKGKHCSKERVGYRHGWESTTVVMGGKEIHTELPRIRKTDGGGELSLPGLSQFQSEDPLNDAIMARLQAGVSTIKYANTIEDHGKKTACISKGEVSRRFIKEMDKMMQEFFTRALVDDYPVIMMDGLEFAKMTILAAIGIDRDGKNVCLASQKAAQKTLPWSKGFSMI